jgi:hypothetical protein
MNLKWLFLFCVGFAAAILASRFLFVPTLVWLGLCLVVHKIGHRVTQPWAARLFLVHVLLIMMAMFGTAFLGYIQFGWPDSRNVIVLLGYIRFGWFAPLLSWALAWLLLLLVPSLFLLGVSKKTPSQPTWGRNDDVADLTMYDPRNQGSLPPVKREGKLVRFVLIATDASKLWLTERLAAFQQRR